ncbi:PASTA domain-containing protein [Streptomyces sp. NPDC007264]|uniref:PASTA domain-containing protein n=1 Tax=Streptomyces sp. NPDC007264 TaxID=3364777 RepID=UPI0036DB5015
MKVTKLNRYLFPAAVLASTVLLTACEPGTASSGSSPAAQPTQTVTATPSPTSADDAFKQLQKDNKKGQDDLQKQIDEASKSAAAAVPTGTLPNFVGMDLQDAQNAAQAAGFYNLRDKDASGQGRFQILDHDWKVCSQEPAPGSHGLEITVTMYAVKKYESC